MKINQIPNFNNEELNIFFKTEYINKNNSDELNPNKLDLNLGFANNAFAYPQPYFTMFYDSDWYEEI